MNTNTSPWEHFSLDELKCKCGACGSTGLEMDDLLMQKIIILREECNFPLPVSSGYRCPAYNAKVSSTGNAGPHTTGKAIDIAVSREQAHALLKIAMRIGFAGIGVNQKGTARFIHLDILTAPEYPRPNIWSY